MVLLPVATREVREASRQPRTYRWRWITAAIALALMAFATWVTRYDPSQGHEVFVAVSTAAYFYCLLAGAVRTADTIAEEKRDNTLGLLFLTDLKGWDIVLGKVLSSSVNCVFGLLALFPMLAIPALMGGVPLDEFGKVILNLLNTLFLSISVGFLISSVFKHSVATVSAGLLTMIFIGGGIPLIAAFSVNELHWRGFADVVMFFTPTQCYINAFGRVSPFVHHYWGPLLLQHLLAWLNLRAAIFFLPRFWQEVPKNKKTERWRERIRAWRFGKGRTKARFRARLLDENPLYWLSNREQVSSMGVMILSVVVLLGALSIGIINTRAAGRVDAIVLAWLFGVAIVHTIIAFRLATAAAWRLAEDRRSGALELLLGTELSIRELLRGHWMALRRQFFGPALIVTLAAIFGLAWLLQMFSADMGLMGLWETLLEILLRLGRRNANSEMGLLFVLIAAIHGMLMLNWIALGSVGMWMGLRERRSGFAPWITLAIVTLPPWILVICGMITMDAAGMLQMFPPQVVIPWVMTVGAILGLSHMLFLWRWSRRNLIRRFREIAADRYSGPRPFPWRTIGWAGLRLAGGAAAIWLLLICARAWVNYSGEQAWKKAIAAHPEFAVAQRAKVKIAPQVPDSENLAKIPLFKALLQPGGSSKQITWNMSQIIGPGRFEALRWDWAEQHSLNVALIRGMYVDRKILTTNETGTTAEQVLMGLDKVYGKDFAALRKEAAVRPQVQFQFEPANSPVVFASPIVFPWINNDPRPVLRGLIDTIAVMSSARIAMGENPLDDVFLGFRLVGGMERDTSGIQQYHEMLLDMTQPIYDGLSARIWKNDELKRIQDYYAGLDLWTRYEGFRKDYVNQLVASVDRTRIYRGQRKQNWFERQVPTGFRQKAQAAVVEWGAIETPKPVNLQKRQIDLPMARKVEEKNPRTGYYMGGPMSLVSVLRSLAFTQTTADQIATACAIERFRNDHGKLPASVIELVPQYLAKVPNDVLIEKPLGYRVKPDGEHYILYSVGSDGADNNGMPMHIPGSWYFWQDRVGDWVWDSQPTDPSPPVKRVGPRGKIYYTR